MAVEDDYKFLYVFGPNHQAKLSAKDPLLISEKQYLFGKVLPAELLANVVWGNDQYTSSLFQALINVWHRVRDGDTPIHLNVVGGDGELGLNGTSEGASANEYVDILGRANHSTYPTGATRMSFDKITYHRQPRGKISGTVMRKAACSYNYQSDSDVAEFQKMLHSGYDSSLARGLMKIIQERSCGPDKLAKK